MLVKCVCQSCSHSYLADDQMGALTCPRCGTDSDAHRNPSDIPEEQLVAPMGGMYDATQQHDPMAPEVGVYDPYVAEESFGMDYLETRFDPQAPPPMIVTGERMVKGTIFGAVATMLIGFALGGAMAAIQVVVPAVAAVIMALIAGAATRYGFGGRTAPRTTGRALFALLIVIVLGNAAFIAGSWAVDRLTGAVDRDADGVPDVAQTREDLELGLKTLVRERARNADTGTAMLLSQRITEAERVKQMSDSELEDYLWVQSAQIDQPLLAYTKLRVLSGPIVQVPKVEPVHLPSPAPAGVLLGEIILAAIIAMRAIAPR